MTKNQIIVYEGDGDFRLDVKTDGETDWLTVGQMVMARLFGRMRRGMGDLRLATGDLRLATGDGGLATCDGGWGAGACDGGWGTCDGWFVACGGLDCWLSQVETLN